MSLSAMMDVNNNSMKQPKISIITPSYNQGKYLEKTILSILNQDYPNLEYIIIDGGSTDNSVEIIKKYESHLNYWVSEKDSGQSEAINKGFRRATGEIINWINSDDYLERGALLKIAKHFQENDIHLLIGQSYNFNERGKHLAGPKGPDVFERIMVGYACPQPSTFMRREALEKLGLLDESLHYTMDWELYARIALYYKFLFVEEVYSWQLLHDDGKMVKDRFKFAEEGKRVYSKIAVTFPFANQIVNHLKSIGYFTVQNPYLNFSKDISKEQIERSFLLFMYKLAHHEYNIINTNQALQNIRLIKNLNSGFYKKNQLSQLKIKCMIPKFVLKIIKKS